MNKDTLYNAYLKDKKLKEKEQRLKNKFVISEDDNTILITKNENKLLKAICLVIDIFSRLLKLVFIFTIAVLTTIGATVLINKDFLNYIINTIR